MPVDLTEIKATSRQRLHEALAVPAVYTDHVQIDPVAVTVRWHSKLGVRPGMDAEYASIIASVNRLVFSSDDLAEQFDADGVSTRPAVTLRHHGQVHVPGYDATFVLDAREGSDGPLNVYWSVVHDE